MARERVPPLPSERPNRRSPCASTRTPAVRSDPSRGPVNRGIPTRSRPTTGSRAWTAPPPPARRLDVTHRPPGQFQQLPVGLRAPRRVPLRAGLQGAPLGRPTMIVKVHGVRPQLVARLAQQPRQDAPRRTAAGCPTVSGCASRSPCCRCEPPPPSRPQRAAASKCRLIVSQVVALIARTVVCSTDLPGGRRAESESLSANSSPR